MFKIASFDIGLRNLGFIIIEFEIIDKKIIYNKNSTKNINLFDICETKTINKNKVCFNLIKKLNETKIEWKDLDYLLIEQQISRNRIMQEISHYLITYLISKLPENKINKVIMCTARNRMNSMCNLFKNQIENVGYKVLDNKIKTNRKKNASKLLGILIEKFNDNEKKLWKEYLSDKKKIDDISDCFFQCLWFLYNKKKIIINNIIN